jgi:D-alanine-D-alanine ligase
MKRNIAVVAGGDSGEYVISMKSARTIKANIDPEKYLVYTILISQKKWVFLDDHGSEHPVDKNDFSIAPEGKKILFDCAFITIHGTPGEDGKLQGYFDLLGIPYTTSGLLPSALTFNKFFCNRQVAGWGIPTARSMKINARDPLNLKEVFQKVTLPVIVKPNKGGSSLGTSLVRDEKDLARAVEMALEHDDEALVEEFIKGIELTCGVFRQQGKAVALPVTQIISKSEALFFDYTAKYTAGASDEITPAPIPEVLTKRVQSTSLMIYQNLELRGMARIDYIYSNDILYFLEVNITPGMTEASIVPQQAVIHGMTIKDLFTIVIEEAISAGAK